MRLFLAVDLDARVREAVERATGDIRRRLSGVGRAGRPGWVAPENLHVTIRFIGEVAADRVTRLDATLSPPVPVGHFSLGLGAAGLFPPHGPPRVLWFAITAGAEPLSEVFSILEQRVTETGVPPERRPFSPHLTVARFREAVRDSRAIREAAAGVQVDAGPCLVREVTLYQSRLGPSGPSYASRLRIPLVDV